MRVRFLWWRLQYPAFVLIGIVLFLANPTEQAAPVKYSITAATAIPIGHTIAESDLELPESGTSTESTRTAQQMIGLSALIPISAGNAITADMLSSNISSSLAPPGKVLLTARLANPEILAFAQFGSTLKLFSGVGPESVEIVKSAQLLRTGTGVNNNNTDTTWGYLPQDAQIEGLSSTVLLAVSPHEAQQLAAVPQWDTNLVAVLSE